MPCTAIELVAHADWSSSPAKRWAAVAVRTENAGWRLAALEQVRDSRNFLPGLKRLLRSAGCILAGFDFPIGLPIDYAQRTGVTSFIDALHRFGHGAWKDFYRPASSPEEISLFRPFYPDRPGNKRLRELQERLQVSCLRRRCELGHPNRRPAAPLFWTLGGQQVGKAAQAGWREVLSPGLRDQGLGMALWPFSGKFCQLCAPGNLIAVETYPAEFYHQLGVRFTPGKTSKRRQKDRLRHTTRLFELAQELYLELSPEAIQLIADGFGASLDGEDRFDALIGLLGMLFIVADTKTRLWEPDEPELVQIEGWIFGQSQHSNYPSKE